jgi:D-aspartate ligase
MDNKQNGSALKQPPPVLVLGEIGLVSSLGQAGVPIIVGSETNRNPVLYSKYAHRHAFFSSYDSKAFIAELRQLGRSLNQKAVIYSDDDRAILNISNHREALEPFFHILYPSLDMVGRILDKQCFTELSEIYDLPAPRSVKISHPQELPYVKTKLKFPCIVKPTQRHFWWGEEFRQVMDGYHKAIQCKTYDELTKTYRKICQINSSVVIQEYVAGGDDRHYSANLFVDRDGEVRGYYIARKLRIYPINAGNGTYIITVLNEEVLNISKDIIRKLDLKGLVNIQFKQDSNTGEYKLMEIHARNSQWSLLGAKAGANLALMYYRHLTAEADSKDLSTARPGVKYFDLAKDIRAFFDYRKNGLLTFRQWRMSLRGDRVFVGLSWRDPWPMLIQLWYILSKRLEQKRVLRTHQ